MMRLPSVSRSNGIQRIRRRSGEPEFKPHACVKQSDIAECARDVADAKAQVFAGKASSSR